MMIGEKKGFRTLDFVVVLEDHEEGGLYIFRRVGRDECETNVHIRCIGKMG